MDPTIIEWDGQRLPEELHRLPPGQYVIEPVLSEAQEAGIRAALDRLDAGEGLPLDEAVRQIRRSSTR